MVLKDYREAFHDYLVSSDDLDSQIKAAAGLCKSASRCIFIGNGGSSSISSHMMEDFIKIARKPALSFTDPALITCFANDYGYADAIQEWLKVIHLPGDCLVAISSSGESLNIVNAARFMKNQHLPVITLTGFSPGNTLRHTGDVNLHVPVSNYGIVECLHQAYIHIILDSLVESYVQTSAITFP